MPSLHDAFHPTRKIAPIVAAMLVRNGIRATAVMLLAAACAASIGGVDPTGSARPPGTPDPAPSPSVDVTALVSQNPATSPRVCQDYFTPPPEEIAGPISVRVIDKTHFEIINATNRIYYLTVRYWVVEDNLVCGRGWLDHRDVLGRIRPGARLERSGGSTPGEIPTRVELWAEPCPDNCHREPDGEYELPTSTVEPPEPGST
jgi:hypothetical protein